jgi:hypothetical protein
LRIFSKVDGVLDADDGFSAKDRNPGLRVFSSLTMKIDRITIFRMKKTYEFKQNYPTYIGLFAYDRNNNLWILWVVNEEL